MIQKQREASLTNEKPTPSTLNLRQQGRRPRSETEDFRQQIMETAVELFARQGYAATSIRQIADRVGVNPAMVHYYFGSKETLLKKTLEESLEPLAEAVAAMKENRKAPLQGIVSLMIGVFISNPDLPILMAREVLLPGGVMQAFFLEHFAHRLGGALPDMLANEQLEGRVKPDADPAIMAHLVLGLCVFPFISRSMAEPALGVSYGDQGIREIERHITELLERGFLS